MPQYTWSCDRCGLTVDIIRSVAAIEQEPDADDDPRAAASCYPEGLHPVPYHGWMRQVVATQPHQRGPNWGRKGNWAK